MNYQTHINFLFIVPTLNAGKNIIKFSNLFCKQQYKYWRVLFIDGGSSHEDISFVKKLIEEDKRFGLIRQGIYYKGIFGAMNQGFKLAKDNEYLFFWGSDDFIFDNNVLEKINKTVIDSLTKNEKKHFYIFKSRYINNVTQTLSRFSKFPKEKNNLYLGNDYFSFLLFFGQTPPHQSTLFSPISRKKLNRYEEKYRLSADLNYFLTLSKLIKVSYSYANIQIVNISDSGESANHFYERILNVARIYFNFYGPIFLVPFLLRYLFKFLSKFKLLPSEILGLFKQISFPVIKYFLFGNNLHIVL